MESKTIDVPVALIFFNRPKQFEQVFDCVRKAAPTQLFLIQDGPRKDNPKDMENIEKCRQVLNIDWDCEVFKDFSDVNLGCGKRIFSGLSRCFEKVDRLIILEDDCVPSSSFFPFCAEVLEKYKNDERVGLITGMNHLGTFNNAESDYFFSNVGSIAGWATWRRSWQSVEFDLSGIANDKNAMRQLFFYQKYAPHRNWAYQNVIQKNKMLQNGEKLTSWSTQFGTAQILQSKLIVVPSVNLMSNIGLTPESANSVSNINCIPRGLRPLYRLKLYEISFPLKHPRYVINDIEYCKKVDRLMHPNKVIAKYRKLESIFLRIIHGQLGSLKKGLFKRLQRKSR